MPSLFCNNLKKKNYKNLIWIKDSPMQTRKSPHGLRRLYYGIIKAHFYGAPDKYTILLYKAVFTESNVDLTELGITPVVFEREHLSPSDVTECRRRGTPDQLCWPGHPFRKVAPINQSPRVTPPGDSRASPRNRATPAVDAWADPSVVRTSPSRATPARALQRMPRRRSSQYRA